MLYRNQIWISEEYYSPILYYPVVQHYLKVRLDYAFQDHALNCKKCERLSPKMTPEEFSCYTALYLV